MDITTETPGAAPAPDLSLNEIITSELAKADAAGAEVVKTDGPEGEPASQGASEADGAHTADPAGSTPASATSDEPAAEPKSDEISAARARKILSTVEEKLADLDKRERALLERAGVSEADIVAQVLRNPKALLAKHGKTIDDVIDASLAEGAAKPAVEDDNPRLTALEKRIADREAAEKQAETQRIITARIAEIHREVTASPKFPVVNETKRHGLVTDYMREYHSTHGQPITWERAAADVERDLTGLGIAVAKKLGWSAPAKQAAAAAPAAKPSAPSIGGAARDSAPVTDESLPEDPTQLMRVLARRAGVID